MEIIKYSENLKDEWDSFIKSSKNGTIFHSMKFLSYHGKDKFTDCSLVFRHKGRIASVFPAALINKDGKLILKSHPGASYGGPIFDTCAGLNAVVDVVDEIVGFAHEEGIDYIDMRLSPRVFHKFPSEELEYVLWYKGFSIVNTELSSAVQLMFETNESIVENMRYNTKQPARKAAENGVIFQESTDYKTFWEILKSNLQKHGATPTHTLNEILLLKELLPNSIKLFCSFKDSSMIAGTVVFIANSVACHTFYIAQDYDYQFFRPLNHLLSETIKWAHSEGFRFLNFGISTESGGTIINPGLFRFKEGFGAYGTVRRYYRKDLLEDEV